MTVLNTTTSVEYTANGVTTAFPVTFYFINSEDLTVTQVDILGGSTELTEEDDYTVTGEGVPAGGTVTFLTAPLDGYTITIERTLDLTQELEFPVQGPFSAATLEEVADRATMHAQQLARRILALESVSFVELLESIGTYEGLLELLEDLQALLSTENTWASEQTFSDGIDVAVAGAGNAVEAAGGTGGGSGVSGLGGDTGGTGVWGDGGTTSGVGVRGVGGSPNGIGGVFQGVGTARGLEATGGATGPGMKGTGGATSGNGVEGLGTAGGTGVSGQGGTTDGVGVWGDGGATNGIGVKGVGAGTGTGVSGTGGASNGVGGTFQGTGTGRGLLATGGATGNGLKGIGGATSGNGVEGLGTAGGTGVSGLGGGTDGTGVWGDGGATNGVGVKGVGAGTGAGGDFSAVTGPALKATGNATRGPLMLGTLAAPSQGVVGDLYVTVAGVLKICTVAGTPGTWVSVGAQV